MQRTEHSSRMISFSCDKVLLFKCEKYDFYMHYYAKMSMNKGLDG